MAYRFVSQIFIFYRLSVIVYSLNDSSIIIINNNELSKLRTQIHIQIINRIIVNKRKEPKCANNKKKLNKFWKVSDQ